MKPRIGLGIAMLSCSLLMTELILTRLFSVTIWYHFAFLAISVALFGIGVASLFLHLKLHKISENTDKMLMFCSVLLGVAILVTNLIIIWVAPMFTPIKMTVGEVSFPTTAELFIVFVAAALPFLVGGFAISLAATRYAREMHSFYFFDLLGAGLGCLLVIPALDMVGAPVAIVMVSALAASAGIPLSQGGTLKLRLIPIITVVVMLTLAATNPLTGLFDMRRAKGFDLKNSEVEFNKWNSFSQVTVLGESDFAGWGMSRNYRGPRPVQKNLFIDLGALTPLISFDGNVDSLRHLMFDLSALVYYLEPGSEGEVCVIGGGGGRDTLSAIASGAGHVTAVEINPIIVNDVVKGQFKEFTGGVYDREDVTAVVDDGRGFIRSSAKKFDVIQVSMVDTSAATAAGAYALTENSLYTIEAFKDYLTHLNPHGTLSFSTVKALSTESGARISSIIWAVLNEFGADPSKNVIVVSNASHGRMNYTLQSILVKNEPFSEKELANVRSAARNLGFQITYIPGSFVNEGNKIAQILTAKDSLALGKLYEQWPINLAPSTDDKPFFFYQTSLDFDMLMAFFKPAQNMGNGLFKLANGRYASGMGILMLIRVALIALVMVTIFLVVPFVFAGKALKSGLGRAGWDIAYVACLGVGFMAVEIGVMQKFMLYLGSPTHTLAVVLFVLLIGGAVGSKLFGLYSKHNYSRKLVAVLGSLVALLVILWHADVAGIILNSTHGLSLMGRSLVSAAILAPVGMLLGIPLPAGLYAVGHRAGRRIPWLWAINSATSVFGSVCATIVSMHGGISFTLFIGVVLYFIAMLISIRVTSKIA